MDKGASAKAETGPREPSPDSLGPSDFDPARVFDALRDAVYVIRNRAGLSEWSRRYGQGPVESDDFCIWVEHWMLMHPIVTALGALDDREIILRADAVQRNVK